MSRTTSRSTRAVLALVAAAAVTGTALPASAAPAAAPSADRSVEVDVRVQQIRAQGFDSAVAAAAVAPAGCPTGTVRTRTLLSEGFEDGLPDDGEFTYGFVQDLVNAPVGGAMASSVQAPTDADDDHIMFMEDTYATPGARTYLSFLARGNPGDDNTGFWVNSLSWALTPAPEEFTRITVDVTAATTEADGYLEIAFLHLLDPAVQTSIELDDVQVFGCAPPPASGLRGDWTGEGTADVLGITGDGSMYLYPGRGDGTVGSGTQVGNGWGAMTWVGSPGDLNGDRRTDLLARRDTGELYLYAGRGAGGFGSAMRIGAGWNGMTAITGGDVDGDGLAELVARRSDGALFRYDFSRTGLLVANQQIGSGWGSFTYLVGVASVDGDRYADLMAVNGSGDLLLYRGTATGLRAGVKVGNGWGAMTSVTSPGDLDRDGRDDLLGRTAAGELYLYRGTVTGVRSGVRIGTGWGGMVHVV